MSCAAGVLISVSVMHIIARSFQMKSTARLSLLAPFLGIYICNHLLSLYICHEDERAVYTVGMIAGLRIGFHAFVGEIIYSMAFKVNIFTDRVGSDVVVYRDPGDFAHPASRTAGPI